LDLFVFSGENWKGFHHVHGISMKAVL